MKQDYINVLMLYTSGKIPQNKSLILRNKLKVSDDSKYEDVFYVNMFDPIKILLSSIFLGIIGIDRILLGDVGLGMLKALFGWLTLGIWHLVDIVLCYKKSKELNFNNIMMFLDDEHYLDEIIKKSKYEESYEYSNIPEDDECPNCFNQLKSNEDTCSNCGYKIN